MFTLLGALMAPAAAHASLDASALEISMYGRVGLAWSPVNGKVIQGTSMNLMGNSIGGRFEEGDYLEPTIRLHVLRAKPEEPDGTTVDFVLTPAMFARNGSFIGAFTNNAPTTLGIEIFQAYIEAGNVLIPKLTLWAGERFYRGTDVHIADYFYFNNLSGQGVGAKYGNLDVAVLLQTSLLGSQYNWDSNGDGILDSRRQRSVLVGQYVLPVTEQFKLHFLGELHLLPAGINRDGSESLPSDFGWVAGVKTRVELTSLSEGSFNEFSVRYGSRAANGSRAGSQTWNTFGLTDVNGRYDGAAGLEVVEHFLYNVNNRLTLNGYGILHYDQGASDTAADKGWDYAFGVRSFVYIADQFHLINEATYQGRKDGDDPWGTAFKFTIAPTIVPTGVRSAWARPHLRLFYTLAVYDNDARDKQYSPYLQTFGPKNLGHYIGARAEWWF
ncbi:carbohydrate porin [Vitiosangium sp. GDMCC 1.1324]|uniref:carbohydrate porin n=1 Tax=Vitiosangium sp. (strain GDMCC 1.1324) TaxID=2138576 RepID=UPI001E3BECFA|nr:carbohydrate porin [Vitiosangium sp. GDMCC 1.1324]